MGRFFVGSRSGEDARYRQKEADLAMTLKAPPEFDTLKITNQSEIPLDWLRHRINTLLSSHLLFEDDITAGMVAESVRRLEDPRHILVTVTALSHAQDAAYKVMQELWLSLPSAPREDGSAGRADDEISRLRRRLESDVEEKRKSRTTVTVNKPARSRSPKRHPLPAHQPRTATTWEQKMREKAWEAATASRR